MPHGRNHSLAMLLLDEHQLEMASTEILLQLLTTHTGRLIAKRGEVLERRTRDNLQLACDQIAWELRRRSAQGSLF